MPETEPTPSDRNRTPSRPPSDAPSGEPDPTTSHALDATTSGAPDPTPSGAPDPTPSLALDATSSELAPALEQLLGLARRLLPPGGLSLTAAATIVRLERQGPTRVTELAAAEGVSQPAMSQLVARLERDGLVERSTDPADARAVRVALTATGQGELGRRRAARVQALDDLLADADPTDLAALRAAVPALRRLAARAGHPGLQPPARTSVPASPRSTREPRTPVPDPRQRRA